jgi:trehalose synthase-fused probable maltokinase
MPDRLQTPIDLAAMLAGDALPEWLEGQRWYASKSRHITGVELLESVVLDEQPPPLMLALIQTTFASGVHDLYQLPVTVYADEDAPSDQLPLAQNGSCSAYDALADSEQARRLLAQIDAAAEIDADGGCLRFHRTGTAPPAAARSSVRPVDAEQSNTSLVFDDELVVKVFRRLEPGINPELEMLRFLTDKQFGNIAPLYGWYDYDGRAFATTLGVAQDFVPGAIDGWRHVLEQLTSGGTELIEQLAQLGSVTGEMHSVLGSDSGDPAFSPETPSEEAMSLLTATIDEDVERIFARLPEIEPLAPIAGRGEEVRELLSTRSQLGFGGRLIRGHGDYHLGQTLLTPRGWVVIDFEGEPARPLPERRQKRPPLRDVASMLRSFAYASSALEILHHRSAPPEFERRAREAFLERYFGTVDSALLPGGETAVGNLLFVYELEKAIYELRYELDNRPAWVSIPVAGIRRMLESA